MKPIFVSGAKIDFANELLVSKTNAGFIGVGKEKISRLIVELSMAKLGSGINYQPDMDELIKHSYFERGRDLHILIDNLLYKNQKNEIS
jgi:hypothetical protein